MVEMQTHVISSIAVEGVHKWDGCNIQQVSYLKDYHRHMFHITVTKKVTDSDREVEIICLKNEIRRALEDRFPNKIGDAIDFQGSSCEQIASYLVQTLHLSYCSVLEDGENGAAVTAVNVKEGE